jgi:hypothetical protein
MTREQVDKLRRIRKGTAQVYGITEQQAADPENPQAGMTTQNKSWCRNIYTEMVMRKNDVYTRDKAKLDKLRHFGTCFSPPSF